MLVNSPELLPRVDPWSTVKRIATFVLNLHLPNKGYSPTHHIQEEPKDGLWTSEGYIEPMAHTLFDHRDYQPPSWVGLPYYTGDPTEELSLKDIQDNLHAPNGSQTVFSKEEFGEHLDGAA